MHCSHHEVIHPSDNKDDLNPLMHVSTTETLSPGKAELQRKTSNAGEGALFLSGRQVCMHAQALPTHTNTCISNIICL